jgi:hypothetical protein
MNCGWTTRAWIRCAWPAPKAMARALLQQPARLVWTVEATSHFEAMTAYYRYRGRGTYTTDFPEEDHRLYLGDDL